MIISRRSFLKWTGLLGTASLIPVKARAWKSRAPQDPYGCLVDLSRCIGCRSCEGACNQANNLPAPEKYFSDVTVFDKRRRPDDKAFTVVNSFHPGEVDVRGTLKPTFAKIQCMHCQDPGCASACLTGAMSKKTNGAVHYDKDKCLGCRYCMIGCAFQMPAYEYSNGLTPRVMKCTFCSDRINNGQKPACASVCPVEAITFGKRKDLLKLAEERMASEPGKYINHVYGKNEIGGTSWMYLSSVAFEKVGFLKMPTKPIPQTSETIQHTMFSYLWSPILLYGVLSVVLHRNHKKSDKHGKNDKKDHPKGD